MEAKILPDGSVLTRRWTARLTDALTWWEKSAAVVAELEKEPLSWREKAATVREARAYLAGARSTFLAALSQEMAGITRE